MGRKYVSMQEELAARKAAAGIDEPARASIKKKEPEKEALSAKFKGLLDKGSSKAKKQVRSRGHEGVPRMVEPNPVDPRPEAGERLEEVLMEPATEIVDAELLDDWEGDATFEEDRKSKTTGTAVAAIIAILVIIFATFVFDDDEDYSEDGTDWTYDSLTELSAESTDEEVIEYVDDELESFPETDSEELNDWIRDTNIGKLMGSDFKFWNATAGDKYLRINALFDEDEDYMTMCDVASENLQDALMDSDMDDTKVLIIAREHGNNNLMYVNLDGAGYLY